MWKKQEQALEIYCADQTNGRGDYVEGRPACCAIQRRKVEKTSDRAVLKEMWSTKPGAKPARRRMRKWQKRKEEIRKKSRCINI